MISIAVGGLDKTTSARLNVSNSRTMVDWLAKVAEKTVVQFRPSSFTVSSMLAEPSMWPASIQRAEMPSATGTDSRRTSKASSESEPRAPPR